MRRKVSELPARASRMMAAATAGTRPSLWAGGSAVRAGAASASEDGRRASSEVVEVGAPVLGGAGGALDGGTSAGVVDGVFFETDAGARTPVFTLVGPTTVGVPGGAVRLAGDGVGLGAGGAAAPAPRAAATSRRPCPQPAHTVAVVRMRWTAPGPS